MKKRFLFMISLLLVIGIGAALAVWVLPGTPFKEKNGTNTNAADKDATAFFQELKEQYPELYQLMPDEGRSTYTIPGLLETETLVAKGDDKGTVKTATDMTPQGLSFVDEFMIISAYSKSQEFHSVLWVIEKSSGQFIKTIVLPTTSHVGGMAYDSKHKRLWITTTDSSSAAQISALNLQTLITDDFQKNQEPITFDYQKNLKDISKSSYMTYDDQALFVGYFDKENSGHVGYFKLDDKGFPQENQNQANAVFDTPEQIQGMTILNDKVIFSQSYGNKDSKLLIYPNPGLAQWTHFKDDDPALQTITVPAYMQQVLAENDVVYLLFESSATKYRLDPTVTSMDRIIKIELP